MLDPAKLSEEEQKLVAEIAEAKGQTVEEVLVGLGHTLPQAQDKDAVVSLEGDPAAEVAVPETPIAVAVEEPTEELEVPEAVSPTELPPPPAAVEEEEPESAVEEEEGEVEPGGTLADVCHHCGWDQTEAVIPEPAKSDKLAFLQSILGGIPFTKRFELFDGNLRVTFRTLTVKEIDLLYESTYEAQQAGKIQTTSDYYEYLNRLRLHLQLVSVTGKRVSLHHSLPDGLNSAVNSSSKQHWDEFLKEKSLYKEDVSLPLQVQDYILDNVLATEQLLRVATFECQKFNRLAAKLEARVDDSDFWKETGPLS